MRHFVTELPKHGDVVLNTKKRTIYKVFGISRHTETQEPCVVYFDIWGTTHHRPLNEFVGYRWSDEVEDFVPRFEVLPEEHWVVAVNAASRRGRVEKEWRTRYAGKSPCWRLGYKAALTEEPTPTPEGGLYEFTAGRDQALKDLEEPECPHPDVMTEIGESTGTCLKCKRTVSE